MEWREDDVLIQLDAAVNCVDAIVLLMNAYSKGHFCVGGYDIIPGMSTPSYSG
jgi:hypothetical protein